MTLSAYRLEVTVVERGASTSQLDDVVYFEVAYPKSHVATLAGETIPPHDRDTGGIPKETPAETPRT